MIYVILFLVTVLFVLYNLHIKLDDKYTVIGSDMLDIIFNKYNIRPKGVIHVGAHECEEKKIYNKYGVSDEKIVWIEGNPDLVEKIRINIPTARVYHGLIADDERDTEFKITNNMQSSSILELKEHLNEHPDVTEINRINLKTTTLPKLLKQNDINIEDYDILVMDIQGAEYLALKGMKDIIKNFKGIHMEVNTKELYSNLGTLDDIKEFLSPYGFVMSDLSMTQHGWGDAYFIQI